ncbi:MAG: hypothetical protein JXA42_04270 [Anaerolineales bacterium]|nr:hypothetical protein [Anaerolineales bacterium]
MKSRLRPYVAAVIAIVTTISAWLVVRQLRGKTNREHERGIDKELPGQFKKRFYYKPNLLLKEMDYIIKHAAELKTAFQSGRVDRGFTKRIMLVVTGVNRCRYCRFGHARSAVREGMDSSLVNELLGGDLSQADPFELMALDFAMHYAESAANPNPEAVSELEEVYGTDMACDILMVLHMITFGNLLGNTFDALISRIKGLPAGESTLWNEVSTLTLLLASIIPYSLALAFQMALVQVSESTRGKMLVLQQ